MDTNNLMNPRGWSNATTEGAFPQLSPEMISRVRPYGVPEKHSNGSIIFKPGLRGLDLFVVLTGALQLFFASLKEEREVLAKLGEGEFTGEMNLLSQREGLVGAEAIEESVVLRIPRAQLKELVSCEPDIGEILMRAIILRRAGLIEHGEGGIVLLGSRKLASTAKLEHFLSGNNYPYRMLDIDADEDAADFMHLFGLTESSLPVVISFGTALKNPTNLEVAEQIGIAEQITQGARYDVVVVGAGPAGLAAAVYAASEGLRTLVVDSNAPGGQAGASSKIENYLGFALGISGLELARQAQIQAQKFGATLAVARGAIHLDVSVKPFGLTLTGNAMVLADSVVIASGARYRRLEIEDYSRFESAGIHYSATMIDAQPCIGEEVIVVGGGNSAGQAALFLSGYAVHVHVLIRSAGLAATMSDYLVKRISLSRNITLHSCTQVTGLEGGEWLDAVRWSVGTGQESYRCETHHLFVMIGADPCTAWLGGCVTLDEKGFVRTGLNPQSLDSLETSVSGVFAVGDVRSGSIKRVASAVGEGSGVISMVHQFLCRYKDLPMVSTEQDSAPTP